MMLETGAPGSSIEVRALWSIWGIWKWRGWQGGEKVDLPAVSPPNLLLVELQLEFNKTATQVHQQAFGPAWVSQSFSLWEYGHESPYSHISTSMSLGPTDIPSIIWDLI